MIPELLIKKYDFTLFSIDESKLPAIKQILINYYNTITLRSYQQTGSLLNPLEICLEIPSKIRELIDYSDNINLNTINILTQYLLKEESYSDKDEREKQNLFKEKELEQTIRTKELGETPLEQTIRRKETKQEQTTGTKESEIKQEQTYGTNWVNDPAIVNQFITYINENYEISDKPETKFVTLIKDFMNRHKLKIGNCWNARYEPLFNRLNIKMEKVSVTGYSNGGVYHAYLRPLDTSSKIPLIPPTGSKTTLSTSSTSSPSTSATATSATATAASSASAITTPVIPLIPTNNTKKCLTIKVSPKLAMSARARKSTSHSYPGATASSAKNSYPKTLSSFLKPESSDSDSKG